MHLVKPVDQTPIDVEVEDLYGSYFTSVKASAKQPRYIGHPFIIYAPESLLEKHKARLRDMVAAKIIDCRIHRPPFLNTDTRMVRVAMNYGDSRTATLIYDLLTREKALMVFKNWL